MQLAVMRHRDAGASYE